VRKYSPQQCFADILSNIETVRHYIGDMTMNELEDDNKTLDAVLRRLENASEAYSRLCDKERGTPEIAKKIEARYPGVPWRKFQSLANRCRHDYDLIDVGIIWRSLEPGGTTTLVEEAIRKELPLWEIPPKL
jgi:uncharacterized protein with HEPN domain